MSESVELSSLDLRYQGHRLRDSAREARLLASIADRGIEDPLQGVDTPGARFLLNGFKRYRCANKLGIHVVPYQSLGLEEATGIVQLMRVATDKGLGILEQARFITDLLTLHGLSLAEVAQTLGRSKGWVAMRRGLLEGMSEPVQRMLFAGEFPVYCYLYTLAPFRRLNGAGVERFMQAVAGQRLSVRDLELLARAYFQGPDSLRGAIETGRLSWSLEQLKNVPADSAGCSEFERLMLQDLELAGKYLKRLAAKCQDPRLASRAFHAQAHLLSGSLLACFHTFQERIKDFHDRCGRA